MRLRQVLVIGAATAALLTMAAGASHADNVRDVLGNPRLRDAPQVVRDRDPINNGLAPLGPLIGSQVANQIPTLSTSAGFTCPAWTATLAPSASRIASA